MISNHMEMQANLNGSAFSSHRASLSVQTCLTDRLIGGPGSTGGKSNMPSRSMYTSCNSSCCVSENLNASWANITSCFNFMWRAIRPSSASTTVKNTARANQDADRKVAVEPTKNVA